MSTRLPSSPTPKNFADVWVNQVLKPALQSAADGAATVDQTTLSQVTGLASDDLKAVFSSMQQSEVAVDALLEAGHRYALAHASQAAGADGRLSVADLQMLPGSLQEDFQVLRSGQSDEARLDTKGYRFSSRVFADVVDNYNISDKQALLDIAIERSGDRYLNKTELQAAAQALEAQSTGNTSDHTRGETGQQEAPGFRWSPSVMARVMSASGLDDEDALLMEAAKHDADGNGYLKRSELEAAAKVLVLQQGSPEEIQEIGIICDLDKTIIPKHGRNADAPAPYPGIQALLHELEFGKGGEAGDITYVTARGPHRVVDIPDYLEEHGIPAGPIETGTSSMPWVAQPEKVKDASKVFDANPDQSFVMFGDTSHRDPEAYKDVIAKYPGRVSAAFIHKVNNSVSPERVEGLYLIENYAEAAAILLEKGIIDEPAARRVMVRAQLEGLDITDEQIQTLLETHQPS